MLKIATTRKNPPGFKKDQRVKRIRLLFLITIALCIAAFSADHSYSYGAENDFSPAGIRFENPDRESLPADCDFRAKIFDISLFFVNLSPGSRHSKSFTVFSIQPLLIAPRLSVLRC